ncbi:hypothetical protein HYY73_04950 [Candidatus Woesearchaeota archaeon]|nr:hypothetical protein [Candidatus Woesearchaeota archaeon]
MKRRAWYVDFGEDSLELLASEVEDLENDELSTSEAGFISGYDGYDEEEW